MFEPRPLGHCGGDCNSRSRLGKAWQIISANVSVFDEMTTTSKKRCSLLLRLSGTPSGENLT
jgi:hypothetical protein